MNSALIKGIFNKAASIFRPQKKVISWLNKKIIKHQPYGKLNSFNYNGAPVYYISPGEFLHAADEIFENEIYKAVFKTAEPLILDCGANIGMSVVYFKKIAPGARVIAYEPDTVNFDLLEKNTKHLSGVTNVKAAVWINEDNLEFEDVGAQGSKIASAGTDKNLKINIVKAVRLRDVLQQQKVDLLKIDIEGAEYEVIKDCKDVLQQADNIFLEYHGLFKDQQHLLEMLQMVDAAGFDFYINSANENFKNPFLKNKGDLFYDQQLNIFCTKK